MIYLATPYSFNPPEGFRIASVAAAFFLEQRKLVFSPILHWHHAALERKLPTSADDWWTYNCHMLTLSSALWVIDHPETPRSAGVRMECDWWKLNRKREIRRWAWENIENASN